MKLRSQLKYYSGGFTLIELMITLSIATIMILVAIPSMSGFFSNNKLAQRANDIVSSLHFARSTALSRETTISLCASSDQLSCNGSADWSQGWLAWVDTNSDANLDAGEEILYVNALDARPNTIVLDAGNAISFFSTGMNNVAPGVRINFNICEAPGSIGRLISLGITGNPAIISQNCI